MKQIGESQTETGVGGGIVKIREKKREGVINERRQEHTKTSENPSTGVKERGWKQGVLGEKEFTWKNEAWVEIRNMHY